MNLEYIEARAKNFVKQDNRLSLEVALAEAVLEQVIISLDNKGLIPKSRIVDKS
jgi:hypothetical protein